MIDVLFVLVVFLVDWRLGLGLLLLLPVLR